MKCKYCHAEIEQDVQFCPNCGKDLSKFKKCVKCGELLENKDAFCPYCGTEQPHYDEEPKSKKWLWGICVVLGIGLVVFGLFYFSSGGNFFLNTSRTDVVSTDSSETNETIAKRLTEIYNYVFSGREYGDADSKYCSKGYLDLVKEFDEAYAKSDIDVLLGPDYDHWSLTNEDPDLSNLSMRIISISKLSENNATAKLHIYYGQEENSGGDVELKLIYENNNWFIDDFILYVCSERNMLQEGIETCKNTKCFP